MNIIPKEINKVSASLKSIWVSNKPAWARYKKCDIRMMGHWFYSVLFDY